MTDFCVKEMAKKYNITEKEVRIQWWFYTNLERCTDVIVGEIKKGYLNKTEEDKRFRTVRDQINLMRDLIEESWAHRGYITEGNSKLFGVE